MTWKHEKKLGDTPSPNAYFLVLNIIVHNFSKNQHFYKLVPVPIKIFQGGSYMYVENWGNLPKTRQTEIQCNFTLEP